MGDDVKRNWDEMAEAFILQYSYNTQIEITTRDLETTRQEPKESFSEFVTRWRAKASMMALRPTDKDQIR
ncbi:retrotransposon gag domain-containing protein, partial [Klebsiella pneumoniae]|uniref:retrotransposon gag domain-containing protein n=1 Tax=Klebsiella pneumoniae TaxID=573 RepID=UPI00210B2854